MYVVRFSEFCLGKYFIRQMLETPTTYKNLPYLTTKYYFYLSNNI